MKRHGLPISAALLLASGCASLDLSGAKNAEAAPAPVSLADAEGENFGFGPLPESALPERKCGMVLWTLEGKRPSAIFRFISGEEAEMNIAGELVKFTRVNFAGAGDFGVFEQQAFRSESGIEVEVNAHFGLGFDGGAYLERGVIKLRDNEGWSVVAPAAGVAGCRS